MNTIKVKTSLLIAGFFNGLNLFCFFSNYEKLSNQLSESGVFYVSDWTRKHANFFSAVQMEKRVMFIILMNIKIMY
jgi:hypothetical protein